MEDEKVFLDRLKIDEIKTISDKISKDTLEFFNKEIKIELKKILKKRPVLKYDMLQIITNSGFNVLLNIFLSAQEFVSREKLVKIDFNCLIGSYSEMLKEHFNVKKNETIN